LTSLLLWKVWTRHSTRVYVLSVVRLVCTDHVMLRQSFQPALQGGFALVLALIQNEDDNRCSVESVPNVLLLMYNQGGTRYVRSDCNDAGFTLRQLDVLSQVVKSTKFAIIRNTKSYLGEKDIGFNSVFTV
jgi:hypothetical protein